MDQMVHIEDPQDLPAAIALPFCPRCGKYGKHCDCG